MSALDTVLQKHLAGVPLTEALSELAGDDPQYAALSQVLALREQQSRAETEETDLDDDPGPELEVDHRFAVLQDQVEAITDDVARLQDTLETVALALGACPVCLGATGDCPLCHGRGVPGSLPPDPAAFDQFVMPAVRARMFVRRRLTGGRNRPGPSHAPDHHPTDHHPTDQDPSERTAG